MTTYRSIEVGRQLGTGQYGCVYKATVVNGKSRWPVALKRIKKDMCTPEELIEMRQDLLTEGEIMASIEYHPNIANLQGVAIDPTASPTSLKFDLLIEYCGRGSLHSELVTNREEYMAEHYDAIILNPGRGLGRPKLNRLIFWGQQIAKGMEYLSSHGIVHGDLATRNVLLTDEYTAKISDFGLSHLLRQKSSADLRHSHVPKNWMSPEAIRYHKVDTQSDVWSFGIVFWEILSLGEKPFRDVTVDTSNSFLDALDAGVRPACPEICPESSYSVMRRCWHPEPQHRPSFHALAEDLATELDPAFHLEFEGVKEKAFELYSSIRETCNTATTLLSLNVKSHSSTMYHKMGGCNGKALIPAEPDMGDYTLRCDDAHLTEPGYIRIEMANQP